MKAVKPVRLQNACSAPKTVFPDFPEEDLDRIFGYSSGNRRPFWNRRGSPGGVVIYFIPVLTQFNSTEQQKTEIVF